MRLNPRIIPGPLSVQNTGALDWGDNGLLAYGSQNNVSIVHMESLQLLQVLDGHKYPVTTVKWCSHNPYHNLLIPVSLLLATADKSGRVIVWEVITGKPVHELTDITRVNGNVMLTWIPNSYILLVLLPPYNIVLWNGATGTKLWRLTLLEPMYYISQDPFDERNMVAASNGCLLFFNDVNTNKCPSNPTRYTLALGKNVEPEQKHVITGDFHYNQNSTQDLIKIVHSPHERNKLFLVYPRQITIIDLEIHHVTGYIAQDRTSSRYLDVQLCTSDNILYCLHDTGAISIRRYVENTPYQKDHIYQCVVVSEAMRLCKNAKLIGLKVKPFTEEEVVFMLTDGRLVGWKLYDADGPTEFLSEVEWSDSTRLVMVNNSGTNSSQASCIRICPSLSTKNSHFYRPLIAIGTHSGTVLVVDLTTQRTTREYAVHTARVCGVEWVADRRMLSYSNNYNSSGPIKNELFYTDINTGRSLQLRTTHKNRDETPIVGIKVSHLHQYFIVLLKDRPFELWDLKTLNVIREMPTTFPAVTTLEWSPAVNHSLKNAKFYKKEEEMEQAAESSPTREHFVFTDTDGIVYHLMVEGTVIKEGTRIPPDTQIGTINSIAWRGDLMVLADSTGHLSFWDLRARQSRLIPTHNGGIRKVLLAPGKNTQLLLVLFNDEVAIWDTADLTLHVSLKSAQLGSKVIDIDWGASDRPLVMTETGVLHVMDINLDSTTLPITPFSINAPIWLPFLYPQKEVINFKIHLQHQGWRSEGWSLECPSCSNDIVWESMVKTLKSKDKFSSLSLLERCLVVSTLYGDALEFNLWQVLAYYLEQSSPLSSTFDFVQDNTSFLKEQAKRLAVQDACRTAYSHRKHCIHRYILLGHTDKPVQLLLEVGNESENFYLDCLKSSLIASVSDSEVAQSTIKLVATNLIANEHLMEGCELLCLIKKSHDACRYMQNFQKFNDSAWLAKVSLPNHEYVEVMKHYLDMLIAKGLKQKAVLLSVSLMMFDKAAEILLSNRLVMVAALLVDACCEAGKWPETEKATDIKHTTYVQYAKYLVSLDNIDAALYYCERGGDQGKTLAEELLICAS